MSGKPYGIKEMKAIVDYLVEQRAYGEIKGRKRWVDLANSQMTTRTWQSLKETFLKRILADIHNPYYKLTMEQIRSFRECRDVARGEKNKLDIRSTSDEDTSNSADKQDSNEPSSTTNVNAENKEKTGENIQSSKVPHTHNRASVETLVLDHESDEESAPDNDNETRKSIRDCIVYTDPLPTMLQEVNSEDEGQLQIDENAANDNPSSAPTDNPNDASSQTKPQKSDEETNNSTEAQSKNDSPKKSSSNQEVVTDSDKKLNDDTLDQVEESVAKLNGDVEKNRSSFEITGQSVQSLTQNKSTDSTLPNNQELLSQNKHMKDVNTFTDTQKNEENNNVDSKPRKRLPSDASNSSNNKRKLEKNDTAKTSNVQKSPQNTEIPSTNNSEENPCLKSVNLYAEQFTAPSFISSDSSLEANSDNKKEKNLPKIKVDKTKEVLLLKSHSDTDSEPAQKVSRKIVNKTQTITKTRTKALADVFGFSSGAVHRKRGSIEKRPSRHHQMQDIVISDSEWTSDSESEFVSPPRARRNRQTKKYIKPGSARITSLEEEGTLFVINGRKIYPLIKDGKFIKNYVNFIEESDDDEEESYWKLKYAQEKKKNGELTKLIEKSKNLPPLEEANNKIQKHRPKRPKRNLELNYEESDQSEEVIDLEPNEKPQPKEDRSIKIIFPGNNRPEVQLEGPWNRIQSAVEQVFNILQKQPDNKEIDSERKEIQPKEDNKCIAKAIEPAQELNNDVKSNEEQPVKRDILELENKIFQEIEEKHKEQTEITNGQTNINARSRGRPRKLSSEVEPSPAKRLRTSTTRTPSKTLLDSKSTTHNLRKSDAPLEEDESQEILYKFPSPPPSDRKSIKSSTRQKSKYKHIDKLERIQSSPENSIQSESTHGYQDSDFSPIVHHYRRKRKQSYSSLTSLTSKHKVKRFTRRRSHPNILIDTSSDSSNSSFNLPFRTTVFKNSSLDSNNYRSESYQLLMPKPRQSRRLESIDETKPIGHEERIDNSDAISHQSHESITISIPIDAGNSSNVSLPVSPELSIVEKLSVNKSLLSSDIDYPTINEIQDHEPQQSINSKFLMSGIDASIPLMQQYCGFEQHNDIACANFETPIAKPNSKPQFNNISDNKPDEINSTKDSLHEKLRDLILNSAKKIIDEMSIDNSIKDQPMEVDNSKNEPKNVKGKKRSSTPRKRVSTKRKPSKKTDVPIVEEKVEHCSKSGRNSCPPSVLAPITNVLDSNSPTVTETPKIKRSRKKKDVIKVKITRPKSRTPKKSQTENTSVASAGTNESGIFVQTADDSIDLIHNHSESCLQAHECVDSSVQLIQMSKSIISVDSDSNNIEDFLVEDSKYPEMYCSNAQDATRFSFNDLTNAQDVQTIDIPTSFRTSDMSIFTEDLSDEYNSPAELNSKWYLLSDDETTKKNMPQTRGSLTANLNQIFPYICAVPDLSTITEMSKDTDSRKPTLEQDDPKNDSNS